MRLDSRENWMYRMVHFQRNNSRYCQIKMITKVLIGFWLEVPTRVSHNLRQHQEVSNRAHLKMFVVLLASDIKNETQRQVCGVKASIVLSQSALHRPRGGHDAGKV